MGHRFQTRPPAWSHGIPLAAAAIGALLVSGCPGNRSNAASGPYIGASVVSFPPGEAPAGFGSNAVVDVVDPASGYPIATASVTVNGVGLAFDGFEYVGTVAVAPGGDVELAVSVSGRSFGASATQFAAFPQVLAPGIGDEWDAYSPNTIRWSPGPPTAGAMYAVGVLDAADPNGDGVWPRGGGPQQVAAGATSLTIPADAMTVGDRLVVAGITRAVAIRGAQPDSSLVVAGYSYRPVRVRDDSGRTWGQMYATGIPQLATLRGVIWAGAQYVAVGQANGDVGCGSIGIVLTSPDGRSWTPHTTCADTTTGVLWGVASSGTQVVAVGGADILSSSDGISWTSQSGAAGKFLLDVASSGSTFVAVGEGGVVLTSPDGITWTERVSGTSTDLWGVTWTGARFVAVGGLTLIVSDDGSTWTPATSLTSGGLMGVASSASATVAAGSGGTILSSADGLSWSSVGSLTNDFTAVASSGRTFVATGRGGTIAMSSDGTSWTSRHTPWGYDLWAAAWNGSRWIAVGDFGTVIQSP